MAKRKKTAAAHRQKILIPIYFDRGDIDWLDRKINPLNPELKSRSAVLRYIVRQAMENNTI